MIPQHDKTKLRDLPFNMNEPLSSSLLTKSMSLAYTFTDSELARISTLTDLAGGKENDGSALIMKTYYPILKEAYGATHNQWIIPF